MKKQFERLALAIGEDKVEKLNNSSVIVFGLGGVGSYSVEALARSGIGKIGLVDSDKYEETNINRQLYALHSTVGMEKCEVAKERILDINPDCIVKTYNVFYLKETENEIDLKEYDYIIDAIDTIQGKLHLIEKAKELSVPIISSMGAGNKSDICKIEVGDIFSTSVDPLAKIMRKELKKRNIESLKVVYSKEEPKQKQKLENEKRRRDIPSSNSFVPPAFGLIMAGEVIKEIIG